MPPVTTIEEALTAIRSNESVMASAVSAFTLIPERIKNAVDAALVGKVDQATLQSVFAAIDESIPEAQELASAVVANTNAN